MLTTEDNELLTRTGPGTPMGELFRQFWQPALLSLELPAADCPPVRIRVLGEDLVAFRDSDGVPGVIDANCPHRRASLFFGRNEESGLRCVYHGWKFDVNGDCVDMPSEPTESNFKVKVKVKSYPARDWGSCVWIYMGSAASVPELPQFEWCRVPDTHRRVQRWIQESNYMQATEGEIDSSHASFLHRWMDKEGMEKYYAGQRMLGDRVLRHQIGNPRFTVKETDYGFVYGARRDLPDGTYNWRVTQFLLPMYSLIASNSFPAGGRGWVPVDDEHISVFQYSYHPERPLTDEELNRPNSNAEMYRCAYRLPDGGRVDTWRPEQNADNDYLIDREMQRTKNYTGIPISRTQDMAMTDSMGAIVDRTREHLGTTDAAIIAARRILLKLARELQEGQTPHAASNPDVFRVRSLDVVSPQGDFQGLMEEYAEETVARA